MSIKALDPKSIRLIGATQTITSPTAVVKELTDNALDAKALSISVELSGDALGVIQVKDSGHGISPDDRHMICKRYCTSKLENYADLKSIGGTSLGFRGEALASIAEVVGSFTVTTRAEGEPKACVLNLGRTGEVLSRESAGAPVGTTIRVCNLFDHVPVRKQQWTKDASKVPPTIKRLLQTYALARPKVRFSLRVQGSDASCNWMYAPKSNSSVLDAVMKVLGKDCALSCAETLTDFEGYNVKACLPKRDAMFQHVSGKGQFISIDGRPVTSKRGTLKQIVGLFKERLKLSSPTLESVKDPFLWLSIHCPSASYDPNVDPAKDDVIFEASNDVLSAVKQLLSDFYPVKEQMVRQLSSSTDVRINPRTLKQANRDEQDSDRVLQQSNAVLVSQIQDPTTQDPTTQGGRQLVDGGGSLHYSKLTCNPWTMAKKAAPLQVPGRTNVPARIEHAELVEDSRVQTQDSSLGTQQSRPLQIKSTESSPVLDRSIATHHPSSDTCSASQRAWSKTSTVQGLLEPPPKDLRQRKWSGWPNRDIGQVGRNRDPSIFTEEDIDDDTTVASQIDASSHNEPVSELDSMPQTFQRSGLPEKSTEIAREHDTRTQSQTQLNRAPHRNEPLNVQHQRAPLAEVDANPQNQNQSQNQSRTSKLFKATYKPFRVPFMHPRHSGKNTSHANNTHQKSIINPQANDTNTQPNPAPSIPQFENPLSTAQVNPPANQSNIRALIQHQKQYIASKETSARQFAEHYFDHSTALEPGMTREASLSSELDMPLLSIPDSSASIPNSNGVIHNPPLLETIPIDQEIHHTQTIQTHILYEHLSRLCETWYRIWRDTPHAFNTPYHNTQTAESENTDEIQCVAKIEESTAFFEPTVLEWEIEMWNGRLSDLLHVTANDDRDRKKNLDALDVDTDVAAGIDIDAAAAAAADVNVEL